MARTVYEEILVIERDLDSKRGIAWSLRYLGDVAHDQGDYSSAHDLYEEALVIQREVGAKIDIALLLIGLGDVACKKGDHAAARSFFIESLAIYREMDNKRGVARSLEGFASLAVAQGQPERALRLAGAAAMLREAAHIPLIPADQTRLDRRIEPARQTLSEEAQKAAWEEGRRMTMEDAIAYALRELKIED